MVDIKKDIDYFQKGIDELEIYLLSPDLYWNLTGLSRLTVGGLLFTKVKLVGSELLSENLNLFQELDRKLETISSKWRVAWENKIIYEISSRLTLWQNYLTDYWNDPGEFGDLYIGEVRWRVILELLADEVSRKFKERYTLSGLDERLRSNFIPGEFIWDKNLVSELPEPIYWFLYGNLRSS